MKSRGPLPLLTIESLPLDSVRHFFAKTDVKSFSDLCSVLSAMAAAGREDALTLLFGLAYRSRDDFDRLQSLVRSTRALRHPEVVMFLAAEFTRVRSSPQSRSYLSLILESLFQSNSPASREALSTLLLDSRVGARYRTHIREYLDAGPDY